MKPEVKVQFALAVCVLIVAFIFATFAFILPPRGEFSDSFLWFFAQCLVMVATLLGLGSVANYIFPRLHEKDK